jgi:hypothetical protein
MFIWRRVPSDGLSQSESGAPGVGLRVWAPGVGWGVYLDFDSFELLLSLALFLPLSPRDLPLLRLVAVALPCSTQTSVRHQAVLDQCTT